MSLLVQKYGGTSVGDPARIRAVAERVLASRADGNTVVVVVSAMGGATDALLALSRTLSGTPDQRELDVLLSTGEQTSAAALALALRDMGVPARSFTGRDAGIVTDGVHGRARIVDVVPASLGKSLDAGVVPVVTGFQGAAGQTQELTTLGRGGSDTTAVAIAAALRATACEIYTDVEGVFTADPRHVPAARKITHLSYEEMAEMAASGAKVLAHSSVEYASSHRVPVHVRSSVGTGEGTWVSCQRDDGTLGALADRFMVTGLAHQVGQLRCRLRGVGPAALATVFATLAETALPLDMVSYRTGDESVADPSLMFTVQAADQHDVVEALGELQRLGGFAGCEWSGPVGKVSLVGRGLSTHPAAVSRALDVLREQGIVLEDMAVYARRVSVTCREEDVVAAVSQLHEAFVAQPEATRRQVIAVGPHAPRPITSAVR
jgi:aspartate kinase